MTINIIPEGFKDDVTLQVISEHNFKNKIIKHFQSFGYQLVKTPLIEYYDKDNNHNTFKISVNKNEKKLVIRDDITLQVARLSKTRLIRKNKPIKLCYYGEVVRKKGSMLRPERQFLQIGAECIGEENFLADVEMMELAYNALNLVGIKNITIEVSSRVFFDKFVTNIKNNIKKNDIIRFIKIKDLKSILKILAPKDHQFIKDLFDCTGSYSNKKNKLKKLQIDESTSREVHNIKNIIKIFQKNNKKINIFLDFCEIDDKNYHSGIRFTFYAKNIRGEVAKGGRYLIQNSKDNIVATGFTCYMDSILRASSSKFIYKNIIVPFNTSKIKINNLIKQGYSILRYTGRNDINKKLAKEQNCQFYLQNNNVISI